MPDINNSVALGIKNDPIDIAGTLAKAAAIRDTNAHADIQQQSYAEREREYGENGGLTSGQRATMSDTQQKAMGPIGNILSQDQSLPARQQALSLAKRAGVPMDTMTEQHLLTAPAAQIKQYGQNAQRLGQSSTTNIEQDPSKINQRNFAGASGSSSGALHGETDPDQPGGHSAPPLTQPQVDGAISTRTNANGSPRVFSLNGNVPVQPGAPAPAASAPPSSPLQRKLQATAQNEQDNKDIQTYKTESANSPVVKNALGHMRSDLDRMYSGKAGPGLGEAAKWVQGARSLPGPVGDALRASLPETGDYVAAVENFNKDSGMIVREAEKSVGVHAASGLDTIAGTLVQQGTSHAGAKEAIIKLTALEDWRQARTSAALQYRKTNGTLDGFADEWARGVTPEVFVWARLSGSERKSAAQKLRDNGQQGELDSLHAQLNYAKKYKLDGIVN